ncbi:MAG: phosphate ABC transporter permease subunit PstC, partial [Mycobacterium sp.]|nr:phosphate ABC transporter permease subunit PstC [Mycobacterium sp.]
MTTPKSADAGSGEVVTGPSLRPSAPPALYWGSSKPGLGDRLFRGLSKGSGVLIVVLIAAIGVFL